MIADITSQAIVHHADDRDAVRASIAKWDDTKSSPDVESKSKYGIYLWMSDEEPWLRIGKVYTSWDEANARAIQINEMYYGLKDEVVDDPYGPIGAVSTTDRCCEVRPIKESPRFDIYSVKGDKTFLLFKSVSLKKATWLIGEHRSRGYKNDEGNLISIVMVPSDQPSSWFDQRTSTATNRDVYEMEIETGRMWEITKDVPLDSAFCHAHNIIKENPEMAIVIMPPKSDAKGGAQ